MFTNPACARPRSELAAGSRRVPHRVSALQGNPVSRPRHATPCLGWAGLTCAVLCISTCSPTHPGAGALLPRRRRCGPASLLRTPCGPPPIRRALPLLTPSPRTLPALPACLQPEAAGVVAALHGRGVQCVMLTGDNWRTARAVASQVRGRTARRRCRCRCTAPHRRLEAGPLPGSAQPQAWPHPEGLALSIMLPPRKPVLRPAA